jgi:nitronate monooxygenase
MDGRGIAAALTLGADAAALGTAYLVTHESAASEPHKQRLMDGPPEEMVITTALSGRAARAIGTEMITEIEESGLAIPPYPAQAALTRPIHAAAQGDPGSERVFMLGGQAGPLARPMGAGELTGLLAREAGEILDRR